MSRSFLFAAVIGVASAVGLLAASSAYAGDPWSCFRAFASCKQACMSSPDYNACITTCQSQYLTCAGY